MDQVLLPVSKDREVPITQVSYGEHIQAAEGVRLWLSFCRIQYDLTTEMCLSIGKEGDSDEAGCPTIEHVPLSLLLEELSGHCLVDMRQLLQAVDPDTPIQEVLLGTILHSLGDRVKVHVRANDEADGGMSADVTIGSRVMSVDIYDYEGCIVRTDEYLS